MLAIKKARKFIESKPEESASRTLADLVQSLEHDTAFSLGQLYELDYKRFELALEIMTEWRLDRHYASKARLIEVSQQLSSAPAPTSAAPGPLDVEATGQID
jgi:hypothetical protein